MRRRQPPPAAGPARPPRAESRGQWLLALAVSMLAHGAAAGWALGLLPRLPQHVAPPPGEIRVTSLPVEVIAPPVIGSPDIAVLSPPDAAAASPQLEPVPDTTTAATPPADAADSPGAESLQPQPGEVLLADPGLALPPTGAATAAPRLLPNAATPLAPAPTGLAATNLAAPPPATAPVAPTPAATPAPAPSGAPAAEPPSPLLLALIDGIRARMTEPCLLALPDILPDGQVRLTVISAGERQTGDFLAQLRELTEGATFAERRLLIDRRQCPALTWLRAAPGYPVFGLGVGLARDSLPSGEALQGAIGNTAGSFTTLLLVDDNGVVQDLRRFLLFSGGQARFDMPVNRVGAARDTSQILIAIATRDRPAGLSELIGYRADAVFPKLGPGLQSGALLGVAPFFVQ